MILVSALYTIAWLPLNIYSFLGIVQLIKYLSFNNSLFYAILCIAFLYTAINPFIYATKFNPVKKILMKMIPCQKTPVEPHARTLNTIHVSATNRRPAQDQKRY